MSEQTKSNVQMIGAGFMGFVAVVGGAGLILTQLAGRRAAPGSFDAQYAPLAAGVAAARPAAEAPLSSPAPLIGSAADDIDDIVDQTAASAATAPGGAPASGVALGAMEAARFAGRGEESSSARAETRSAAPAAPDAPEAEIALKPVPRPRLDKTAGRASLASAVRYGVTDRAELMGRAAGPVSNFTGRSVAGNSRLTELAHDAQGRIADVEKSVDSSTLTTEQKRDVKARLKDVRAGVAK